MKRVRPVARAGALLAAAALLVLAAPAAQARQHGRHSGSLTLRVDAVSPTTPQPTVNRAPLDVTLTLTNTTSGDLHDVQITGERGDPIGNQQALDASLASRKAPASPLPITPLRPVTADVVPADTSVDLDFSTTTSTQDNLGGICLCHPGYVYPLVFTAHATVGGAEQSAQTTTYLPSFYAPPAHQLQVGWVWPLIDRPHRFLDDTTFTDDALATSVSTGRLARALDVVRQVGPSVPITLVVDPELLDELEVMATVPYTVQAANGHTTPGTGRAAAVAWLKELRDILQNDPGVHVELTPYADPDVEALTHRGATWHAAMPATMSARVSNALAGRPMATDLSWPATGAVSRPTLRELVRQGVDTIVLNAASVAGGTELPGLARLAARRSPPVAAVLTSTTVERYVDRAVASDGSGTAALPQLLAELAVRVAQQPQNAPVPQFLALTAPRYVDPDVPAAVQTIEATSQSVFAAPAAVGDAVRGSLLPTQFSHLAPVTGSRRANRSPAFAEALRAARRLHTVRALLDSKDDTSAAALLDQLPAAIQRGTAAAWAEPGNAAAALGYAKALDYEFNTLREGVHIVRPSSGHYSYTLGSNNSPVPITVDNSLPYTVRVRIHIAPKLAVPGFHAKDIGSQTVEARQTRTFHIPTTTERSGRIQILASLLTANGRHRLGNPVQITVRVTALGVIGVIITAVAGGVLALALLWRFARRWRNRRAAQAPPAAPIAAGQPEPVR